MPPGKRSQNVGSFGRNYARGDLAGFPVPHTDDDGFSFHPPFPQSLVGVLVGLPSAKIGLVDFASPASEFLLVCPGFPYSMRHEPGRFLGYVEVPVQLHAGNALEAGQVQVDGDYPLLIRDIRSFQRGSGADRKASPAVTTPKRHALLVSRNPSVASALGASYF